ncbi:MAG: 8-oxo-dGTP diphosphatase [Candidatus Caenarcaniphilales bacterium]|nr:8-oxo-dGTP diphosphatase [Candidatus Caenarcaniphilales bacterium]
MKYQPIMAASGYVLSQDKKQVLMLHRNARESDDSLGKWMGIGGKMAADEDIVTCLKREALEEAGIICTKFRLRGTINWTGFGPRAENWFGFLFLIEEYSGLIKTSNPEGTLHWVPTEEIYSLNLWKGDLHFLPLLFDEDPRVFHAHMAYDQDEVALWRFERI